MRSKRPSTGLRRANDPPVLILTSLVAGPKHGHALAKDINEFAGVSLGPGALYGAITRLEERGLIEALESEDRRRPVSDHGSGLRCLGRGGAGDAPNRRRRGDPARTHPGMSTGGDELAELLRWYPAAWRRAVRR